MTETVAIIGLGSNLDDPVAQLRRATEQLAAMPGSRLGRCSSVYRTAPVGYDAQPDFYNAVCQLFTSLDPHQLLARLQQVEQAQGRRREGHRYGPRTLDLDLLLFGEDCLDTPDLQLPHPRMHERGFVLYPLQEIMPGMTIPGRGSVTAFLPGVTEQGVEKLDLELVPGRAGTKD